MKQPNRCSNRFSLFPFNLPIDFGVIYKKLPPPPLEYNTSHYLSTLHAA
jgi:hypothetical protein